MKEFAETRLGKGVVVAKDVPNFVGNRMFSYIISDLLEFAIANDYTVDEVDQLTGPLIGRPKTGTFRLLDVVGIDVAALVGENLYEMVPDDDDREVLRGPLGSSVLQTLLAQWPAGREERAGLLQEGSGQLRAGEASGVLICRQLPRARWTICSRRAPVGQAWTRLETRPCPTACAAS